MFKSNLAKNFVSLVFFVVKKTINTQEGDYPRDLSKLNQQTLCKLHEGIDIGEIARQPDRDAHCA